MGWRVWEAYERDRETQLRSLPWRERYNWFGIALFALFVAFAAALVWVTHARAAPINADDVRVIDGDTIRVFHKKPDVRLVGFNAPETSRAACAVDRGE